MNQAHYGFIGCFTQLEKLTVADSTFPPHSAHWVAGCLAWAYTLSESSLAFHSVQTADVNKLFFQKSSNHILRNRFTINCNITVHNEVDVCLFSVQPAVSNFSPAFPTVRPGFPILCDYVTGTNKEYSSYASQCHQLISIYCHIRVTGLTFCSGNGCEEYAYVSQSGSPARHEKCLICCYAIMSGFLLLLQNRLSNIFFKHLEGLFWKHM